MNTMLIFIEKLLGSEIIGGRESHQPGSYEQGISELTSLARSVPVGRGGLVNLVAKMKCCVLIGRQFTFG